MQRKRRQPSILNSQMLADELGLPLTKANELMHQTDFPATEVIDGYFVVERSALEKWVSKKQRNADSWLDLPDFLS